MNSGSNTIDAAVACNTSSISTECAPARDPSNRIIYFKGSFVPAREAMVSVLSPTAQFGLNVFEGVRAYWDSNSQQLFLFRLDEHIQRLFQSCKLMGLVCPLTPGELKSKIIETLLVNEYHTDVAVRVTVFVDEEGTWASSDPVCVFIAPVTKPRANPLTISGKSACISTWRRIDDRSLPPRVKSGANYVNGRYAHLEAKRNGYDLPVLLGVNDKVSEGAGACLFLVRKGQLITPPTSSSILESITRDTIFTLAEDGGLRLQERDVDRTELYVADEVFLCGSAAELTPITSVDRMPVGDQEVGEITRALLSEYLNVVSSAKATYAEWRTPVWQN